MKQSDTIARTVMPQVRIANTYARRGTFGFALGSLAASFGLSSVYLLPFGFPFDLPFLDLSLGFVYLGFAIGGAIGGVSLAKGTRDRKSLSIVAIAFGLGFVVPAFLIPLSMISLAQEADIIYGGLAWSLGLSIGGAIGGFFLPPGPVAVRVLLMLDGGFAFAVGGAIGGATTFGLWSAVGPVFAIFIGLSSAMTIGGAVLGICLDRLKKTRGW